MDITVLLQETQTRTVPYYDLAATELAKAYTPGKWSIKKILVHLADAEAMLHERIKRVIAEPRQVIWAFDQDRFCNNLDYENYPLHLSKALFLANREAILFLADKFYTTSGSNEFIHSETGLRTLQDEFDKVVTHNQNHLHQIEAALRQ